MRPDGPKPEAPKGRERGLDVLGRGQAAPSLSAKRSEKIIHEVNSQTFFYS